MARSAASKVTEIAETLLTWLRTQPAAAGTAVEEAKRRQGDTAGTPDGEPARSATQTVLIPSSSVADGPQIRNGRPNPSQPVRRGTADRDAAPLRLPHTDWLHHHLAITGPTDEVAAFGTAACGAGIIPWHLDLDGLEEDWFLLLLSPPPPQQRTLRVAGARALAGQLREAVARRHEIAVSAVGRNEACPFDLHALVPVPEAVLRLGPEHPQALAWLWEHWGTTQALRRVVKDAAAEAGQRRPPLDAPAALHLNFWSADWTPWRVLAQLRENWPTLRFDIRPSYDGP